MSEFEITDEAKKEVEQMAKAYTNKHHPNASYYVKLKVRAAFVEAYTMGLRHALMVATEAS